VGSGVPRSHKDLRGFQRITLDPGEHREVQFTILPSDLEYFDTMTSVMTVESGRYELQVGASSEDIREMRTITVQ
jgi:beta-glucosidase